MHSEWHTDVLYGQLPDADKVDGVMRVTRLDRYYFKPTVVQKVTKYKIIHVVDEGQIVRLSPARQLNYGAGHTYPSHYGLMIMAEGKIYRVWPKNIGTTLAEYEQNLQDYKRYNFGVSFEIEECPICLDAACQKMCRNCYRGYSCNDCPPVDKCPLCRAPV